MAIAQLTMNAADVRERLTRALRLDLVGPEPNDPQADEVLDRAPSRWYLTGFLVPPRSPSAIAAAVAQLVESPGLREAQGLAGRAFVSRHYNWPDNAAQMELVYKSLLPS